MPEDDRPLIDPRVPMRGLATRPAWMAADGHRPPRLQSKHRVRLRLCVRVAAEAIRAGPRSPAAARHPAVVPGYAASSAAMRAVLGALAEQGQALRAQLEAGCGQHPDAEIYLSQPRLGPILAGPGARPVR
jgi:hypothetical protein